MKTFLLSLAGLTLLATAGFAAETLYGISNGQGIAANNQIYQINPANGNLSNSVQVTLPGFTVLNSLALAARPGDGVLFAVIQTTNDAATGRRLVTVNPTTGVCTDVGPLAHSIATLAFRSNGTLYGVNGQVGANPETLFTLSTTTGAETLLFALGSGDDGETIAFHPNGLLYHSSGNTVALFDSIDVDTQVVTPIGSAVSEAFAMGYSTALGQMFLSSGNRSLYTVDIATGARTLVGNIPAPGRGNRGLAFVVACTTVVTTADSGAGSLREAINCANATPGTDTISFAIPGGGVQTISPMSSLPTITDPVIIDGYTQPGAAQNTNVTGALNTVLMIELNGISAGNDVDGLKITAGGSTVKGLVINRFSGYGIFMTTTTGGNSIQGNFLGTDPSGTADLGNIGNGVTAGDAPNNTIGGTAPGARNLISGNNENGVSMYGSTATMNLVQGNLIGTDVNGTADLGNTNAGVYIYNAPNNTIGGTAAGARNIISGNNFHGVVLDTSGATGNKLQGNFIGTDVTGTFGLGNTMSGVLIQDAPSNKIGGGNAGEGNVISGNDGNGIFITGATAQNNQISQNLIGRNAANSGALGNAGHGVFLTSSGPNIIGGGFLPGNANTIAHNGGDGVAIVFGTGPCIKKGIVSNSIFSNGGLGIDLEDDGVTLNDVGDGDTGANTLQNFPVLTSASTSGGSTTINGSLNSTANTSFHIEFFASVAADPTSYGEGQTFLGYLDVMTDNAGNVPFSAVLPMLPPAGQTIISSTATDNLELANTSEFSKVVQLAGTAGQLQNISTRLRVLTGDNILIGGIIITGVDPKKVMLRAIGPSLQVAGTPVPGRLADPTLTLHNQSGTAIAFNDNWGDAPEPERTEIENGGLKPDDSFESAMIRTLDPGAYTAIVRGKDGTTGIGLVEAYDLNPAGNSRLANLSTRGFVDTGDNVMIGGVIVGGGGGGSAKVVVRGLGPSLNVSGVPVAGRMADPTLQLVNENGDVLIENDNWQDTQQTEIQVTGLAPSDDFESAIVTLLPPGGTTAILRGNGDTTGVALVEVFNVP